MLSHCILCKAFWYTETSSTRHLRPTHCRRNDQHCRRALNSTHSLTLVLRCSSADVRLAWRGHCVGLPFPPSDVTCFRRSPESRLLIRAPAAAATNLNASKTTQAYLRSFFCGAVTWCPVLPVRVYAQCISVSAAVCPSCRPSRPAAAAAAVSVAADVVYRMIDWSDGDTTSRRRRRTCRGWTQRSNVHEANKMNRRARACLLGRRAASTDRQTSRVLPPDILLYTVLHSCLFQPLDWSR